MLIHRELGVIFRCKKKIIENSNERLGEHNALYLHAVTRSILTWWVWIEMLLSPFENIIHGGFKIVRLIYNLSYAILCF
jgi:hypothetical protein